MPSLMTTYALAVVPGSIAITVMTTEWKTGLGNSARHPQQISRSAGNKSEEGHPRRSAGRRPLSRTRDVQPSEEAAIATGGLRVVSPHARPVFAEPRVRHPSEF